MLINLLLRVRTPLGLETASLGLRKNKKATGKIEVMKGTDTFHMIC